MRRFLAICGATALFAAYDGDRRIRLRLSIGSIKSQSKAVAFVDERFRHNEG